MPSKSTLYQHNYYMLKLTIDPFL